MISKGLGMRIVFAGDRDIAVWVLRFILDQGVKPVGLLIPRAEQASHADSLISLCAYLEDRFILKGTEFRSFRGLEVLSALKPDYIISVHFPYIIPTNVLRIPKVGVVNLHPAFLPYNRGWHTPSWALLDNTPYGATLHFMTEEVDAGDIIHQKRLEILPEDTADTLYKRVKRLELEVFQEAWPWLLSLQPPRYPQDLAQGTFHRKQELFNPNIQKIDLEERVRAGDLLKRLRALTTNRLEEAAYFELDGKRWRVQVKIIPEGYSERGEE